MAQYDFYGKQHYTHETPKEIKDIVSAATKTQSLALNTNTAYLSGLGDSNTGFNLNAEIKSTLGHGKLMGYDASGKLLMRFRVAITMQNGYVGRDEDVELTPYTLQGAGRMQTMTERGQHNIPYLDMALGRDSGVGGFVLTAPKVVLNLEVVADPSGVTGTGEVIYHATLVGSGDMVDVYLVIDEDAHQQRLPNVPSPQAFFTATPPQVKESDPTKEVSWLKLPVGTLGDDVVQLSETNLINESRLLVQDTIKVVLPVMKPESETELMDAITALAAERGFTRIEHDV